MQGFVQQDAEDGQSSVATLMVPPAIVLVPLLLLAVPSVVIGYLTIGPMLYGFIMDSHMPRWVFGVSAIFMEATVVLALATDRKKAA